MPYTITVDQPNLGEGGLVVITGLGRFKNGEQMEVTDEQVAQYELTSGQKLTDAIEQMYGVEIHEGAPTPDPKLGTQEGTPEGNSQGQEEAPHEG